MPVCNAVIRSGIDIACSVDKYPSTGGSDKQQGIYPERYFIITDGRVQLRSPYLNLGSCEEWCMTDPLAVAVTQHLQRIMQMPASNETLSRDLLQLATNYRLEVLRPRAQSAFGNMVVGGLFAGIRLLPRTSEG